MARGGVPFRDLMRTTARIVPIGLAVGAAFEAFMYYTGFWDVALRKEAERRAARREADAAIASTPTPIAVAVEAPTAVPQPQSKPPERPSYLR